MSVSPIGGYAPNLAGYASASAQYNTALPRFQSQAVDSFKRQPQAQVKFGGPFGAVAGGAIGFMAPPVVGGVLGHIPGCMIGGCLAPVMGLIGAIVGFFLPTP